MFGARGYSRELPLERMARDVRMFTIGGGTAQVLRTLVASRMLGWKLPQTRDGYSAQAFDARRCGVIMHPVLCKCRQNADDTDLVCPCRKFRFGAQGDRRTGAHIYCRRRFRSQSRPADAPPRRRSVPSPAHCSGSEGPGDSEVDRFRPGQLSGLLPPGIYRFANAPHDARLAALAFALGAYQFARYRKTETRNVRLHDSGRRRWRSISARIVEGATLCAGPHQYPVQRHGTGRTGRG